VDSRHARGQATIYGGTGHLADWHAAATLVEQGHRVILAGGLTPDNVAQALERVGPWMVDIVSGVEARKGVKDAAKVRAFIESARRQHHLPDARVSPAPGKEPDTILL
jgi:phosphoribosylanthranilate isomerase